MAYMDLIIKHRLKFFILSLLVIGFVIIKLMPSFIFKSVLSANEGIGYSAVVSALRKAGTYIESETEPGSLRPCPRLSLCIATHRAVEWCVYERP